MAWLLAGGPEKAGIMPNKPRWHKEKSRDLGLDREPWISLKSS
jgi:hypothetical protein